MKKIKIIEPERWTSEITKHIRYYLPNDCNGGVVIDCGCNIGAFELKYLNRFDKYVCVDILKENIEILNHNLNKKNINFIAINKACFDESGKIVPIYAHQIEKNNINYFGNSGNAGIILHNSKINNTVNDNNWGWFEENMIDNIETISINDIIDEYSNIKILKFDIEGAEYKFLLNKDLSKIEYLTGELHFEEYKQKELINFIEKTHNRIFYKNNIITFKRK